MATRFCFDCVYLQNLTVLCYRLLIYLNIYGINYLNSGAPNENNYGSFLCIQSNIGYFLIFYYFEFVNTELN